MDRQENGCCGKSVSFRRTEGNTFCRGTHCPGKKDAGSLIEVTNLSKKYGNHVAVSDLSFTIEKGVIYGFLGPNGAGKSTTMNIITGCLGATEGEVLVGGHSIAEEPMLAKKMIGYLPEQPPLYTDMTPAEYLNFVAGAKKDRPE